MAAKTPRCGQESAYMSPPSVGPPPTTPPPVGAASSARERELSSPPTARRLHSDRRRAAGEGGRVSSPPVPSPRRPFKIPQDAGRGSAPTPSEHAPPPPPPPLGPSIRGGARCGVTRRGGRRRRSGGAGSCRRRRRWRPRCRGRRRGARPCIVHKRGTDILHDPWFNKVPDLAICMPRSRALGLSRFRFWHTAGHGVPHDGAGSPWPPRPPPAAGHVVRAAVRPLQ